MFEFEFEFELGFGFLNVLLVVLVLDDENDEGWRLVPKDDNPRELSIPAPPLNPLNLSNDVVGCWWLCWWWWWWWYDNDNGLACTAGTDTDICTDRGMDTVAMSKSCTTSSIIMTSSTCTGSTQTINDCDLDLAIMKKRKLSAIWYLVSVIWVCCDFCDFLPPYFCDLATCTCSVPVQRLILKMLQIMKVICGLWFVVYGERW